MAFKTFGELNTELINELDLQDETFIDAPELMRLWNRAVGIAEGHLITLGLRDKYLLGRVKVDLTKGFEEISLPDAVYGNKIIKIIYQVGSTIYTVKPLDSKDMFENYALLNQVSTTDIYRYMITHTNPGQEKLLIVPTPYTTQANALTIWFARNANRYFLDTDICDLPTLAYEFLNTYVTEKVYKKESHVNYEEAKNDRIEKEQLMQSVLSGQIADNEMSKVDMDISAYQESS